MEIFHWYPQLQILSNYLMTKTIVSYSFFSLTPRAHNAGEIWKQRFHALWKRIKCFLSTLPGSKKFENATITGSRNARELGFITWLSWRFRFRKAPKKIFRPYENAKPAFWNFSGLKSVLEKLRFRDGLVWTVGRTVEIKLLFQSSLAQCGWGLRELSSSRFTFGQSKRT